MAQMELHVQVNKDRLINSVKTAIACLTGFFIAYLFDLPVTATAWILITIVVVMSAQINVGGVIIKSTMRFLGTLAGALASGLVLISFGDQTLTITIFLFISIFLFSYLASSSEEISNAGLLGAATVVMILLSQDPNYQTAIARFIEISLAIFIAFLVSKFIFPIHAYEKIYETIAENLENYIKLYELLWKQGINTQVFLEQEVKIINIFAVQRKLMREAKNELTTRSANQRTYHKILTSQREVFRYICLMHHALLKSNLSPDIEKQLSLFNQHVYFWLEQLVKGLKNEGFKLKSDLITNTELVPLIQGITQASLPSSSQQLALDAFFFCALNLVKELRNLTRLVTLLINRRKKQKRSIVNE